MKLRSFSIGTLMFIVALAAVDGRLLRQIDLGRGNPEILSAAGVFVMVNILAFALFRIVFLRAEIALSWVDLYSRAPWRYLLFWLPFNGFQIIRSNCGSTLEHQSSASAGHMRPNGSWPASINLHGMSIQFI